MPSKLRKGKQKLRFYREGFQKEIRPQFVDKNIHIGVSVKTPIKLPHYLQNCCLGSLETKGSCTSYILNVKLEPELKPKLEQEREPKLEIKLEPKLEICWRQI